VPGLAAKQDFDLAHSWLDPYNVALGQIAKGRFKAKNSWGAFGSCAIGTCCESQDRCESSMVAHGAGHEHMVSPNHVREIRMACHACDE